MEQTLILSLATHVVQSTFTNISIHYQSTTVNTHNTTHKLRQYPHLQFQLTPTTFTTTPTPTACKQAPQLNIGVARVLRHRYREFKWSRDATVLLKWTLSTHPIIPPPAFCMHSVFTPFSLYPLLFAFREICLHWQRELGILKVASQKAQFLQLLQPDTLHILCWCWCQERERNVWF